MEIRRKYVDRRVGALKGGEVEVLRRVREAGAARGVYLTGSQARYGRVRIRAFLEAQGIGELIAIGVRENVLVAWLKETHGSRLKQEVVDVASREENTVEIGGDARVGELELDRVGGSGAKTRESGVEAEAARFILRNFNIGRISKEKRDEALRELGFKVNEDGNLCPTDGQ